MKLGRKLLGLHSPSIGVFSGLRATFKCMLTSNVRNSYAPPYTAGADSTNTLAVAWVGQQGESTGTSVHSVTSEGKVEAVWKHHQECGGSNFDSINNNGLAMTANGGQVYIYVYVYI